MQTGTRGDATKKCLFGGTLIAAGLATPGTSAQTIDFVDSNASAYTTGGGTDSFRGSGTWYVESHYSGYGYGDAVAWGMPTSLGLYAYGTTDTGGPSAYAQVDSQFTVSSDVVVTVDWYLFPFLTGFLSLTDLTNDVVLLSPYQCCGSLDIPLFADRLYEYSSGTDYGYTSVTIIPAPASAALLAMGGLLGRRRRRRGPEPAHPPRT